MLNTTNHQGNANETKMTGSLTTVRIAVIKKRRDTWQGCRELVGMQVSVASMENGMAASQKIKNRLTK